MDELLNIGEVTESYRKGTAKCASRLVVLLSQPLNVVAEIDLELSLQIHICILRCTGADHEEKTSPLYAQRLVFGAASPPKLILFQERLRVDDVVMKVDIVEEILDKNICQAR